MSESIYYCEDLTAIPYPCMVKAFSASMPVWLAKTVSNWYRFRRIIRWSIPANNGMGETSRTRPIQRHEVHAEAAAMWAPMLEQLHDLQFQILQYRLPAVIGKREQCSCILLHQSGKSVATLEWQSLMLGSSSEKFATLEFNSYPQDEPEVLTAALNPPHLIFSDAFKLPFIDAEYLSNQQPLSKVFAKHEKRSVHRSIVPLDPSNAISVHLRNSERRLDWLLEKGYLRRLSRKEVARCLAE